MKNLRGEVRLKYYLDLGLQIRTVLSNNLLQNDHDSLSELKVSTPCEFVYPTKSLNSRNLGAADIWHFLLEKRPNKLSNYHDNFQLLQLYREKKGLSLENI